MRLWLPLVLIITSGPLVLKHFSLTLSSVFFKFDLNFLTKDTSLGWNQLKIVLFSFIFSHCLSSYQCNASRNCKHFFFLRYILFIYLLITIQLQIIFELSNFDHVFDVVSQTRVSGVHWTHDPHANSLAHYPLDYQGTRFRGCYLYI